MVYPMDKRNSIKHTFQAAIRVLELASKHIMKPIRL